MKRIPVSGPWITEREIRYVSDAVTNGWYENANAYTARFEEAFAEYLDVRYAVTLPSCTAGIHLALLALGIGPGDEVIVPEITWIASAAPVSYVGATPVFADVDRKTWCISAESLKGCITSRTKAVIPVDLYGGMPDWGAIRAIASSRKIAIVEDAAQAIGSEYRGRKAGSFGDAGVFSFHGAKTLTTGEGGMLVTNREDLYRRVQVLRDHGRTPGDKMFINAEVGYKYKMSGLQAALGLAQLERVEELVARKRAIFEWYREELLGVAGITLNAEPPETKNTFWMVTVILDQEMGLGKKQVMDWMDENGVDCRPFFHPLSSLPAYECFEEVAKARARNSVSYDLSPHGVNLPSGLNLSRSDVHYVCGKLKAVLAEPRLTCRSQQATV